MSKHTYKEDENILIYHFSGKLDTKYCLEHGDKVHHVFEKHEKKKPKVIFDFKEVIFVSSSFIRVCMVIVKNTGTENFKITNTNPMIKKTFKIARLEELLGVS